MLGLRDKTCGPPDQEAIPIPDSFMHMHSFVTDMVNDFASSHHANCTAPDLKARANVVSMSLFCALWALLLSFSCHMSMFPTQSAPPLKTLTYMFVFFIYLSFYGNNTENTAWVNSVVSTLPHGRVHTTPAPRLNSGCCKTWEDGTWETSHIDEGMVKCENEVCLRE